VSVIVRGQTLRIPPRELDPAIVGAARRGEGWACRELVRFHERPIHALMWRMLGSAGRRQLAEDLTQEAFLRAFRSLPRFDPRGAAPLSSWLLRIAARTAIDELRRRRPTASAIDEVDLADRAARPDEVAQWASTARAVREAVDRLSPEVRAAFVLRAYHELSYPEIADALEIDLGTVKSRLFRARQALAERLREIDHG
jgi:RNA polymerase sigma-70 factor (ECF subfamily)